ncbi:uncharacterized protein BJX67DRAFT_384792 [Aspergillus lucknowensis]|uniref:Telomeric single stranded DNA binding POT1/Cdc13 domain-containing protein n=1 Tax=Aspergillus lucknowensis TaxID=176173 RepID=A0ABR4LIV5_9EURO
MDTDDQPPGAGALRSTAIPIAQLSPDVDRLEERSIYSVVTLLWPYSSSTKSLSFLLAEPDFRLRRSNGQVKVLFHGHVAAEVAKSHVGIGDKVYLSLAGSRLVKNDAVAQTPGKSVSWDLHFDGSAFFEVWRDSNLLSVVKVNRSSSPPALDNVTTIPSTPGPNGNTLAYASGPLDSTKSWQSPAFLERSRISFGLTDTTYDPFAEEDGYVPGKGRKRPRFSMRSNEWRVLDEPESPGEKDLPGDWMAIFDEELASGSDGGEETTTQEADDVPISSPPQVVTSAAPSTYAGVATIVFQPDVSDSTAEQPADRTVDGTAFLHPDIAPRSVPELAKGRVSDDVSHPPTDTPRLQPVPSPGLPDPSPIATPSSPSGCLISGVDTATAQSIPPSVLRSEVISEPRGSDTSQVLSDGEAVQIDEDDAVTVYTDDVQVLPESVPSSDVASFSPQDNKEATTTPAVEGQPDGAVGHTLQQAEADIMEAVTPVVSVKQPNEESEPGFEGREEDANVKLPSPDGGEKSERDEQISERSSEEAEEQSERMSATRSELEGHGAETASAEGDRVRFARNESNSPEESREVSEEPDRAYEDEEEDDVSRSDKGTSYPGDYEEDHEEEYEGYYDGGYEEDYEEEEVEHLPQDGYDGSGSEIESDYEEEPQASIAPKKAEPEIIVLDSDSEDEISTQRPNDMASREMGEPSEGSYDSVDRDDVEEEFYDEVRYEDEELEEEEGYESDEGREYEMEEELEDEQKEGDRGPMNEYPEEELSSGSERMVGETLDEGFAEDHYHSENAQARPDVGLEAVPAEPPEIPGQAPKLDELPASHEHFEEIQTISDRPHGSLRYLATVSGSAERIEDVSESLHGIYGMAIDPSLYEFGAQQDHVSPGVSAEDYPPKGSADTSKGPVAKSPESKRAGELALQLDGASPPAIAAESTTELMDLSIRHAAEHLVTPGPSQQVAANERPTFIEISDQVLPTPDLTQEATALKVAKKPPPSTPPGAQIIDVLDEEGPSLTTMVKSEVIIDKQEHEEGSEHEPLVVAADAAEPPPSEGDQKVQASIEVDNESKAAIHTTSLSPIDRHYPGWRSKLSYFAPLATLIDHYNALVDTISIACEVRPPTKATAGKKDFILTLQVTDPSMAGTTVYAQILRPYKSALPTLQEGDAVLLRNFRVKSFDHSIILVSDCTSAWAVFSTSTEEPEVAGPPIEYGSEEKTFATDLRQWYVEGGMAMVADNQLQASVGRESRDVTPTSSSAPSDAGSIDLALREDRRDTSSSRGSKRRKSHRRITIHELRDGRRYTEVGSSPGEGSIHELRDGTVYANL